MFEFAISQHRKHPPTRRFLASAAISVLSHFLAVLILIEYPELLRAGYIHWFSQVTLSRPVAKERQWRTVTVVRSAGAMERPSAETLRKYAYDWAAHARKNPSPPIRVRWGNEPPAMAADIPVPATSTKAMQDPRPPAPAAADAGAESPQPGSGAGSARGTTAVYLPPPGTMTAPKEIPKRTPEVAGNTAPSSVPDSVKQPTAAAASKPTSPPQEKVAPRVFENEQSAIRTEGSGLFDTKGFPLGEYANLIIERIKGNWMIPSNLRNSQGRTTVIFFIDRDGRFSDARIVTSSGSSSLDLAALNAVIGSNPFPPLPKGFPGNHIGAKFVFSYNERQ